MNVVALCCCFAATDLFAQSPKAIEADLLKAYKKIDYWVEQRNKLDISDSLKKANDVFSKKLIDYTEKYPYTIAQAFNSLKKENLDIVGSADGLLRIYSWDTWLGGTMVVFENVFQYKVGDKTQSIFHPIEWGRNVGTYQFYKISTFSVKDKTYYLVLYYGIYGGSNYGQGIQVFAIENGKLNENVKLFKTPTGFNSKLYYSYHLFTEADRKVKLSISFDPASQTIKIPLIANEGKITHKFITYKFTGLFFEKVKS